MTYKNYKRPKRNNICSKIKSYIGVFALFCMAGAFFVALLLPMCAKQDKERQKAKNEIVEVFKWKNLNLEKIK